jgi:ATP-dependent DNA helicase RecG
MNNLAPAFVKNTRRTTVGETVGETANKILKHLQIKPRATRDELAELLDLSIRGIEYNINMLKKSGKLKRIGSTKSGH